MVVPKRDRAVGIELSSDPSKPAPADGATRDPEKTPHRTSEAGIVELVLPRFLTSLGNGAGRSVSPAAMALRVLILVALLISLYIMAKCVAGFRDNEPAQGARPFSTELCRFEEPWFVA